MSASHSVDETAQAFERSVLAQRLAELVHSRERVLVSGSGGTGKSLLLQAAFPAELILVGNHLTQVMSISLKAEPALLSMMPIGSLTSS